MSIGHDYNKNNNITTTTTTTIKGYSVVFFLDISLHKRYAADCAILAAIIVAFGGGVGVVGVIVAFNNLISFFINIYTRWSNIYIR